MDVIKILRKVYYTDESASFFLKYVFQGRFDNFCSIMEETKDSLYFQQINWYKINW